MSLPDNPNLDWLRKQAKRRLAELREANPDAQLADAQFELAKQFGFSSWRALRAQVDSLTVNGQLVDAARNGDVNILTALLDKHPDGLHVRSKPYEWSLLHHAASNGHLAAVDLLLRRGLDVNTRETGDNTYAMHWSAAAGHLDVVRRLAEAGGDVVGHGDDHELEVIGWATCWDGCDAAAHRAVANFLVSRGAGRAGARTSRRSTWPLRVATRRWFVCFSAPERIQTSAIAGTTATQAAGLSTFNSRRSWRFSRITRRTRKDGKRKRTGALTSAAIHSDTQVLPVRSPVGRDMEIDYC